MCSGEKIHSFVCVSGPFKTIIGFVCVESCSREPYPTGTNKLIYSPKWTIWNIKKNVKESEAELCLTWITGELHLNNMHRLLEQSLCDEQWMEFEWAISIFLMKCLVCECSIVWEWYFVLCFNRDFIVWNSIRNRRMHLFELINWYSRCY